LLVLVFYILSAWLIFQLIFPFLTVAAARLFGRERVGETSAETPDYACIITAYQNSAIAKPLVLSLLQQTYSNLTVYLVADDCPDFEFDIQDERFVLLRPETPLRLKANSILYAMDRFQKPHAYTVVFDADNLAHPVFLEVINRYTTSGYTCVQGQRSAKNLDNSYAAADSLGEIYKNYIERYAPYLLGGSAVISGSGMATHSDVYRAYLDSPEIREGRHLGKKMLQEDKILQNFLLRRNERIAFARDAICYDEKVSSGEAVQTQRSRWLFSYFQNIPNALGILRRGILGLRANQFFFGIVTLALPMFIQLGMAFALAVAGLFLDWRVSVALTIAVFVFAGTVLWTLRLSRASRAVWQAVKAVPKFIWRQMRGLLRMRDPDKFFKHSVHEKVVNVEEVITSNGAKSGFE